MSENRIAIGIDPGKEIALAYRGMDRKWKSFFQDFKKTKPGRLPLEEQDLYGSILPRWCLWASEHARSEVGSWSNVHILIEDWVFFKGQANTQTSFMNRTVGSIMAVFEMKGARVWSPIRSVSWKQKLGLKAKQGYRKRSRQVEQMERQMICTILGVPLSIYGKNSHVLDAMAISQILQDQLRYGGAEQLDGMGVNNRMADLVETFKTSQFP